MVCLLVSQCPDFADHHTGVGGSIKHDIVDMFYTSMGYPRIASGLNRTLISEKSRWAICLFQFGII